jgi:hypothetical protein
MKLVQDNTHTTTIEFTAAELASLMGILRSADNNYGQLDPDIIGPEEEVEDLVDRFFALFK